MTAEAPVSELSQPGPNLLKGDISECEVWRDEPRFEYNSIDGFKSPEDENHLYPVLITFARSLLEDKAEIRHIRIRRLVRHTAAILVVERNGDRPKENEPFQKNYSLEVRKELQIKLDDFLVPHVITRIFKVKQPDSPVEFLGFDLKDRELDPHYIEEAIKGDNDAFGLIFITYSERIRRYVAGILNNAGYGRDRWLSDEDITQETFEKAYKARHRFVKYQNIPVAAWLFRIAANTTTNHFRSGHYKALVDITLDDDKKTPIYSLDENARLELQVVGQIIEGLSERQQQILALSSLGYHDFEIAWMLSIPKPNSIRTLRHHGRVSLRKEYIARHEGELSQYYLIMLAHRLLISKINRGKSYWEEGQLRTTVLQSLKGIGFRESQVEAALYHLPGDFFEKLANVQTVPRQNKSTNSPLGEDLE